MDCMQLIAPRGTFQDLIQDENSFTSKPMRNNENK